MHERVERVAVVVPACDEQELVERALTAIGAAADRVAIPVHVVVVTNGSADGTAELARAAGATVIDLPRAGVGVARDVGARAALQGGDPRRTWLASTDADSEVPSTWIEHHLALADRGADVVLGTVTLSATDLARHPEWWSSYHEGLQASTHSHVHGAHLGIRGSTYLAAGGFAAVDADEDVDLVRRLRGVTPHVVTTLDAPVVTSARTTGRAVGGVADDLAAASVTPAG